MKLILSFYDAAIGIVEGSRAFKFCVANRHIGTNCAGIDGLAPWLWRYNAVAHGIYSACLRHGKAEGSIYTEDSLWLEREPTREEILADIESHDLSQYEQLCFVGFGEPSYRIEDICWVIDRMKEDKA